MSSMTKYRQYRRRARLLLIFVGLWPVDERRKDWRVLSSFVGLSLGMLSFTALSYCYNNVADVDKLTRGLSWCISNWTMLLKVILFVVYRDRLAELNQYLRQTISEKDRKSLDERSLQFRRLFVFIGIYYTMIVALAIAFTLFAVIPLFFIITERKYLLVYPGKYPFGFELGGRIYYLIYGYEALLAGLFFCVGCGTDTAFGLWVFELSAELRLLGLRFRRLQPGLGYRDKIRACLEHHEALLRCREHLQCVFGPIVLWLYVTISLVLCEYIYKMSKMSMKFSFWQAVMIFTFATKFLQAFTYAYCGSIVDIESEKVLAAIYECEWPGSGDKRIMNDVLSLLMQRPMDLRSYNYFRISMEMFLKIINAAVSYFFLLRTLEA